MLELEKAGKAILYLPWSQDRRLCVGVLGPLGFGSRIYYLVFRVGALRLGACGLGFRARGWTCPVLELFASSEEQL